MEERKNVPIIFIPGIKGSQLVNTYPVDFEVRWSLEDMVIGNITEDPLDFELREGLVDRNVRMMLREGELIKYAYERMIDHLRREAGRLLYTFPYDWRKSIAPNARRLREFIEHVQSKSEVNGKKPKVSFVTHSMGALVLTSALGLRGPEPFRDVDRIAYVAPPFRGSCGIFQALITGEKSGWICDEEDFRKLARSFPAVYEMLPSYRKAVIAAEDGKELDPFDLANWQENVTAGDTFQPRFLRNAEVFVRGSKARYGGVCDAPLLPESELRKHPDKILVILSVGHETPYQIPVKTKNPRNRNWFDFEHMLLDDYGDKRVHLRSAAIEGLTLAAYCGANSHSKICRDRRIIKSVALWLRGERVLKMKPRTEGNSVERPRRSYFKEWDGRESSFSEHIAGNLVATVLGEAQREAWGKVGWAPPAKARARRTARSQAGGRGRVAWG